LLEGSYASPAHHYDNGIKVWRGHVVVCFKLEGRRFESRRDGLFNWPNPSSRTMALG
jgi:hypothetical protein